MKNIPLLSLIVSLFFVSAKAQTSTDSLKQRLSLHKSYERVEKLYIQTDRPFYGPGEDVWYKVYVVNPNLQAETISTLLYTTLYDPKGQKISEQTLLIRNNGAWSSFKLPESGGLFTLKAITEKMAAQNETWTEKEIQVQNAVYRDVLLKADIDKKSYVPGEKVLADFSAKSFDGKPVKNAAFTAQLLTDGKVNKEVQLNTDANGKAHFSMLLPKENFNDAFLNIAMEYKGQKASFSKNIPTGIKRLDLQFLPEGGTVANGLPATIAFKALNEYGKSAEVAGEIVDEEGKHISYFESFHAGMGKINFVPQQNKKYFALLSKPFKSFSTIALDLVFNQSGLSLHVADNTLTEKKVQLFSSEEKLVRIMGRLQEEIVYTYDVQLKQGLNEIKLQTENFAPGIMQLSVFEGQIPVLERLTFVNKHKKLKLEIKKDKEKYSLRDLVKLNICVKDEKGNGVSGNFAISVSDERTYNQADDKQGNIMAHLLLCQDLKGEIEEPAFYFDEEKEKANEALDLVMLTNGWRRINTNALLTESVSKWAMAYKFKRNTYSLSGTLFKGSGRPFYNATVQIDETNYKVKTDKNGRFQFTNLEDFRYFSLSAKKGLKSTNTYTSFSNFRCNTPINSTALTEPSRKNNNPLITSAITFFPTNESFPKTVLTKTEIQQLPAVRGSRGENDLITFIDGIPAQSGEIAQILSGQMGIASSNVQLDEVQVVNYIGGLVDADIKSACTITRESYNAMAVGYYPNSYAGTGGYNLQFGNSVITDIYYYDAYFQLDPVNQNVLNISYQRSFYTPYYYVGYKGNGHHDHRKTLYWKPDLSTDKNGNAEVSFPMNDDAGAYRITVEGISNEGKLAYHDEILSCLPPVTLKTTVPAFVTSGDNTTIKMAVYNNQSENKELDLRWNFPSFIKTAKQEEKLYIPADSFVLVKIPLVTGASSGKHTLNFTLEEKGIIYERLSRDIEIIPSGFPQQTVLADKKSRTFDLDINNPQDTNVVTTLEIFPNMAGEFLNTVKNMMREPHGCFEQVSSGNYPNIMALRVLKASEMLDAGVQEKAMAFLKSGYAQLVHYETPEGGFDWWGRAPSHTTLTAFGLMQFKEMKDFDIGVDEQMLERTVAHLLKKREANGGFIIQSSGLDGFHGVQKPVSDAYITWVLSEYKAKDIDKSIAKVQKELDEHFDVYRACLLSMTYFNTGSETKAEELLNKVEKIIRAKGVEKVEAERTLTCSQGVARNLETIALYAIAKMKQSQSTNELITQIVNHAIRCKTSTGYYSTQSTAMTLKMFEQYTLLNKPMKSQGTMEVFVNGKLFNTIKYEQEMLMGLKENIPYSALKEGKNKIEIKLTEGSSEVLYSIKNDYYTYMPSAQSKCDLQLRVNALQTSVKKGEMVNMKLSVKNLKNEIVPQSIARLSIPAGCQVNMNQLKELKDKKIFDYFELFNNEVVFYFEEFAPKAERTINLYLDAVSEGTFKGPACSAYVYYMNEEKSWANGFNITVTD